MEHFLFTKTFETTFCLFNYCAYWLYPTWFLSASAESTKAINIVIYSLLSVLLFSFLIFVSTSHQNFPKYLINWTSIGLKNYFAALTFTMIMFSIAGIPPLAGFFSKFFVLLAAITNNYHITSFIVIIISSIACFYYIRLIKIFFFSANSKLFLAF